MNHRPVLLAVSLLLAGPLVSVRAATINYVGTEVTGATESHVAEWSATWVAKSYDLGNSERYGTAGYYQIRPHTPYADNAYSFSDTVGAGNNLGITAASDPTRYVKPTFVNTMSGTAGYLVNYPGYSVYRDHLGSGQVRQGAISISLTMLASSPHGTGSYGHVISFTLNQPASFRLGVSTDSVGGGSSTNYSADFISVWSYVSGTIYSGLMTRDGNPDMAFFDITGNAGEEFRVTLWRLGDVRGGLATLSLITFDQVPASCYYTIGAGAWSAGFAPAITGGNEAVFAGPGGSATNDYAFGSVKTVASLKFNTNAGAYTLVSASNAAGFASTNALGVSGSIVNNSSNAQTINLALNFASTHNISAGSNSLSFAGAISNGGVLTFAGSASNFVTGVISGPGAITKGGTGVLTLSSANTYTGATMVTAGTLALTRVGGQYTGTIAGDLVISNATVRVTGANGIWGYDASVLKDVTLGFGGFLTEAGNTVVTIGDVTLAGGTLTAGDSGDGYYGNWAFKSSGAATVTATENSLVSAPKISLNIAGPATMFDVREGRTLTVSSALITSGGGGPLLKTGAGTLVLSGSNTYNGVTTVDTGTLLVNGNQSSASGIVTVKSSGILGGAGTIGGNTTVETNGSLAFQLQTPPAGHDSLDIKGTLTLRGRTTVNLSVSGNVTTGSYTLVTTRGIIGNPPIVNALNLPAGWFATSAVSASGSNLVVSISSPYLVWAGARGLAAGVNDGLTDDPDHDGVNNLGEFGLDGNPLSGAPNGKMATRIASIGGEDVLTLTVPVRKSTTFLSGIGELASNPIEGLMYRIQGTDGLYGGSWMLDVDEVTGGDAAMIQAGMPTLSDLDGLGGSDWEYKTFRLAMTVAENPTAFMRALVVTDYSTQPLPPELRFSSAEKSEQSVRTAELLTALEQAVQAGQTGFVIPPGHYRFPNSKGDTFLIQGATNLIVDGRNSTFWFDTGTVRLEDCKGVTLKNLIIDADPPPFMQGVVVAIDTSSMTMDVDFDPQYRTPADVSTNGFYLLNYFSPDGSRVIPKLWDAVTQWQPLGGNRHRAVKFSNNRLFNLLDPDNPVQPGNRVAFSIQASSGGVSVIGSSQCVLEHINVYGCWGYAFFEKLGDGGHSYRQCVIGRRPGTSRLLANGRDGFHSYLVKNGPLIEGCDFSRTMDDLIAVHGFFSMVYDQNPAMQKMTIVTPFEPDITPGSDLTFMDFTTGQILGKARASQVTRQSQATYNAQRAELAQRAQAAGLPIRDFTSDGASLAVVLDRTVAALPGIVGVMSEDRVAKNTIIRNNHIHDALSTGMVLKTHGLTVESNRIERAVMAGIAVFPGNYWMEGPFPRDVRISGNYVEECASLCYNDHFLSPLVGSIQVSVWFGNALNPPSFFSHTSISNVVISGNQVVRPASVGLFLANTERAEISGNLIDHPLVKTVGLSRFNLANGCLAPPTPEPGPLEVARTPYYAMFVMAATNVYIGGNVATNPPPHLLGNLGVGPWVQGLVTAP